MQRATSISTAKARGFRGDLVRWCAGLLMGTVLVGITSPLMVRSYVPRKFDAERNALVFESGHRYRWRSEGYATTSIGPHGMAGRLSLVRPSAERRVVALWGDSQAEGMCVDDSDKIHSAIEDASLQKIAVLPFARSGDDCVDWIRQIESIDSGQSAITVDAHLILVVEWSDWMIPIEDPRESVNPLVNQASGHLPAFLIQAVRNVITDGISNERRSLRFRPGPISSDRHLSAPRQTDGVGMIERQFARLRLATEKRCVLVNAPMMPAIVGGEVLWADEQERLHELVFQLAIKNGIEVIDLREDFRELVRDGQWPRGFHNGRFGDGHYNALGNAWIANRVVAWWDQKDNQAKTKSTNLVSGQ
ncbi:hypothetical protein U8335_24875 [Roseiconus lacunae]|uniref:hypothetical protein n=1 Tax=Roseiconus lacunae TaxID=2605694 RepID=UPI0030891C02|nr:hypothetical protein U8335_24875 [Stieleria sp. HD01]